MLRSCLLKPKPKMNEQVKISEIIQRIKKCGMRGNPRKSKYVPKVAANERIETRKSGQNTFLMTSDRGIPATF